MPALTAATLDIGANGQYKAAQGIITADKPAISITATLNSGATAFTVIKANVTDTASAAASLLIDLQVGGVSQFKVTKAGALTAAGTITASNDILAATNGNLDIGKTGSRFSNGWINNITVSGTSALAIVTASSTITAGSSFNAVISGSGAIPAGSFGANYYNDGAARVRPDTAKAGLMWEMDATDSVYLQYITAAGVASTPARITTGGALTLTAAIAIGNTVAAAAGVASTHKVTMVIGGTTYYLLATNVA